MNTQNTPVHISLWHRSFWALVLANMFLSMSVTALIPILPLWMMQTLHSSALEAGVAMFACCVGMFSLGGFCSYLVQRFRRNHVCLYSVFCTIICIGLLYFFTHYMENIPIWIVWMIRLLTGAAFGLSQMVLSSTLIIDKTESFQRTEANHVAAWFRRFALSLGPTTAIPVYIHYGFDIVLALLAAYAFFAMVLIRSVRFPFKTPDESVHVYSLDRFFLPQTKWLFVNMLLITSVLGLLLSAVADAWFYGIMMIGFFLAIIAEKFMFADADIKSEAVVGLILIGAASLLMLTRDLPIVHRIVPVFVGLGFGIIGSRFMLFFIKLSHHCQRGTSQSSFFLTWELGIGIGLLAGYGLFYGNVAALLKTILMLTVVSLLLHVFVTHPWYMANKNR